MQMTIRFVQDSKTTTNLPKVCQKSKYIINIQYSIFNVASDLNGTCDNHTRFHFKWFCNKIQ